MYLVFCIEINKMIFIYLHIFIITYIKHTDYSCCNAFYEICLIYQKINYIKHDIICTIYYNVHYEI